MQAGPKLDILVATRVIGLELWPGRKDAVRAPFVPTGVTPKPCLPPAYSTDIAAAWKVVEKLQDAGMRTDLLSDWRGHRRCLIVRRAEIVVEDHEWRETAPLAICLAALMAVDSYAARRTPGT